MSSEHQPGEPSNSARLRARAQERMRDGLLPLGDHVDVWGGQGSGFKCLVCDAPILEAQLEFEVEVREPYDENGVRTARFHRECHVIWDSERVQMLARLKRVAPKR